MSEMRPESQAAPEAGDLGLSPDQWMDLQFAYNSGLLEPQEGTAEAEAFRRMDGGVRRITSGAVKANGQMPRIAHGPRLTPRRPPNARPRLRPGGMSPTRGPTRSLNPN